MPLIRIDATDNAAQAELFRLRPPPPSGDMPDPAPSSDPVPVLHASAAPLRPALRQALLHPLTGHGPVTIMVHGYSHQPGLPGHCPHEGILGLSPRPGTPEGCSWPRRLGLGRDLHHEGLGVSFGWNARGSIWRAFHEAERAGHALAALVAMLHRLSPLRDIHIIGHSMGGRVALSALRQSTPGKITRIILLAPAEFDATARDALGSAAGASCETLHVASGGNGVFDRLAQGLVSPPTPGARILGLSRAVLPQCLRLEIDCAETLEALAAAGFRVAPPRGRISHRAPYLRPGLFPLYRAFLRGAPDLATLRGWVSECSGTEAANRPGP